VGGIQLLMFVSGAVLALGAVRTAKLPDEAGGDSIQHALRTIDWKRSLPSFRATAQWILASRTVAIMTLVGASVVALFDGLNSLMPVYMRDVLGVDPAATVYIFAPGAIGFLVGTVAGPRLMHRFGERPLAAVALAATAAGAVLFGLVDVVAPVFAPVSPLRVLELFGITLSAGVLAAGLIAIPFSFGSTAAGAAVQTYLNRLVPLANQGAVFGMQELLENLLTLLAILGFGVIATLIGPRFVFILAPPLVISGIVWLIRESYRRAQLTAPTRNSIVGAILRPPVEPIAEPTAGSGDQSSGPERQ
jgi:MFS family permease